MNTVFDDCFGEREISASHASRTLGPLGPLRMSAYPEH